MFQKEGGVRMLAITGAIVAVILAFGDMLQRTLKEAFKGSEWMKDINWSEDEK